MTIVIDDSTIMFLVFISGWIFGAIFCWLFMKNKAEIDDYRYDHFELSKIKLDAAIARYEMENGIIKPPKPLHNPHL